MPKNLLLQISLVSITLANIIIALCWVTTLTVLSSVFFNCDSQRFWFVLFYKPTYLSNSFVNKRGRKKTKNEITLILQVKNYWVVLEQKGRC